MRRDAEGLERQSGCGGGGDGDPYEEEREDPHRWPEQQSSSVRVGGGSLMCSRGFVSGSGVSGGREPPPPREKRRRDLRLFEFSVY